MPETIRLDQSEEEQRGQQAGTRQEAPGGRFKGKNSSGTSQEAIQQEGAEDQSSILLQKIQQARESGDNQLADALQEIYDKHTKK